MIRQPEASSKVGERLQWLSGHKVRVRLRYAELGQLGSEEFVATYIDTAPMGRVYFFIFQAGNKRRLVQTEHVVEMATVEDQAEDA
jgi:hypothetical protein